MNGTIAGLIRLYYSGRISYVMALVEFQIIYAPLIYNI